MTLVEQNLLKDDFSKLVLGSLEIYIYIYIYIFVLSVYKLIRFKYAIDYISCTEESPSSHI